MDLRIPDELKELKELVRKFVQKELAPLEKELIEEGDLPNETWKRLEALSVELGLYNLALPEEYGGSGVGVLGQVLCAEELGKVLVGFRHLVGDPLGAHTIFKYGTPAAREKYGTAMVNAEKRCGWGMTEHQAGSDLSALATAAVRKDGKWLINGTKHFMTGADRYQLLILFVVTDKEKKQFGGFSGFVVETGWPGFIVGREEKMMGREGLHSYELYFEDMEVPEENLLGKVGQGFEILMDQVNRMRLMMGGTCVGTADRLINMSASYANMRQQFGRPIGDFEAIQWMLADAKLRMEAAKALTYDAAIKLDQKIDATLETAMVKMYATEMVFYVADRAMQLHGGSGYCKDLPIESIFRACRLFSLAEGTSEIMRMLIGRRYLAKGILPQVL
jgi:acyl-CoA dehydrogenase